MERQRVEIGGGTLDAVLTGAGPVTVVFENGLGSSLEQWDAVAGPIEARARVLRYDRWRAAPTGRVVARTAMDLAEDLSRLLSALHLQPPYLIVGHSWGGAIARVFAHEHPRDVAGMVLVDATNEAIGSQALALLPLIYGTMRLLSHAGMFRRRLTSVFCPPGTPAAYRARVEQRMSDATECAVAIRTAQSEGAGIRATLDWLRRTCPDLPPIPVHVLTAQGAGKGAAAKSAARVREAWQTLAARTPSARHTTVPTSGHHIPFDAPQVVASAIEEVLPP